MYIMPKIFVLPFIFLLFSVALGPILCKSTWERYSTKIILSLAFLVAFSYIFIYHDYVTPIMSTVEYIDFILLIVALYIISGGIYIDINTTATPLINTFFLFVGAICANFIGTTGAATLLIRPFMKINKNRLKPYHIVFFIFIVCNVGGCLSVIGDPPIFIAFLKGMPFLWPIKNNFLPWLVTIGTLLVMFYFIDRRNSVIANDEYTNKPLIVIEGKRNFFWIILTTCVVFINPVMISSVPTFSFHGHDISFLREILLAAICVASFKFSKKDILKKNDYSWEPINEVIILFFGIFITMRFWIIPQRFLMR